MGSRAARAEQRTEAQLAREIRRAQKGRSTVGLLSTLTGPRQWERPEFEMPMPTMALDMKELGVDRGGRHWFSHKKYGECIEGQLIDATNQVLPNSLIVEVGPDKFRSFGSWAAPGTFERLVNTPGRAPIQPKPLKAIDMRELYAPTRSRPQRIIASTSAVRVRSAVEPAKGPAGILGDLAGAGINVALAADREHLAVSTQGGILLPDLTGVVDTFDRLLVAYLRGAPLACEVNEHKRPVEAVTVIVGGAAACAECVS